MSSLNISELYEPSNNKKIRKLRQYDNILKKVHHKIRYSADNNRTYCTYNVPSFIIGEPLYDVNELKQYIVSSLTKNGFKLLHIEPNWLFITWEIKEKKTPKINKKKNSDNYRLIDEYKPTGSLIYSENELSSLNNI